MRSGLKWAWLFLLAAGIAGAPRQVTACVPVFYVAHGFAVSTEERTGVNLPANARGIIYYSASRDGSVVPVAPTDFVVTDRYRRRISVEVVPVTAASGEYRFFIRPVGGFVAGESYSMVASAVEPESQSPYAAQVFITVGAPLDTRALERDASIITGRYTEVMFNGASARYAPRVTRALRSDSITPQTDCEFVPSKSIRAAPGCHIVKASLSFPEVDDREVRLAALVCGGWLALPWRS